MKKNTVSNLVRALSETIEEFVADKVAVPSTSVELLSSLIHNQWSEWARNLEMRENLTPERLERWNKLYIPYEQLSEDMKDKDREYAIKFLNEIKSSMIMDIFNGYLASIPEDWNYIMPSQVHDMLKSGELKSHVLVDLRKKEDYTQGHIPGAINIFWMDMMKTLNIWAPILASKKVILICYLGFTASQVLPFLRLMGVDCKVMKFGMGKSPVKGVQIKGWIDYNYEVEK